MKKFSNDKRNLISEKKETRITKKESILLRQVGMNECVLND
jgi:hypothetical protein